MSLNICVAYEIRSRHSLRERRWSAPQRSTVQVRRRLLSPQSTAHAHDEGNEDTLPNTTIDEVQSRSMSRFGTLVEWFTKNKLPVAPWGLDTLLAVMLTWIVGFWAAAYTLVPIVLLKTKSMIVPALLSESASHALRHLILDATQIIFIVALFSRSLREYKPLSLGFFRCTMRSIDWFPWVLFGCACFPCVDWLHRFMVSLVTEEGAQVVGKASTMFGGHDTLARALWIFVLGILAPMWEELIFRGFLLPSLSTLMSPGAAVVMSSMVFALVHFSKEGFLPLLVLGIIFGMAYRATGNIFPAIFLHSAWNLCLLSSIL